MVKDINFEKYNKNCVLVLRTNEEVRHYCKKCNFNHNSVLNRNSLAIYYNHNCKPKYQYSSIETINKYIKDYYMINIEHNIYELW